MRERWAREAKDEGLHTRNLKAGAASIPFEDLCGPCLLVGTKLHEKLRAIAVDPGYGIPQTCHKLISPRMLGFPKENGRSPGRRMKGFPKEN